MRGFDNSMYKKYEGIVDMEKLKVEYIEISDEIYRLSMVKREIGLALLDEGISMIMMPNGSLVGFP